MRSAAERQREQALGLGSVILDGFEVLVAVFADRDDDLDIAPEIRHAKTPPSVFDARDRRRLADRPARAVGVDPADAADPPVMVEAVARTDAVDAIARDLVARGHRPLVVRLKVLEATTLAETPPAP